MAAGGEVHATPAHGSPLQTPLAQPKPHVVSLGVYVQPPPLHTPPPNDRRVDASTQYDAGGAVHETPRHGSPLQLPLAQPLGHAVSWDEYEHVPPRQVPGDVQLRRVDASAQVAVGGEVQLTPAHGSPTQPPLAHPLGHVTSLGV